MKIIQLIIVDDCVIGLGDDGQIYDYCPTPYVILGLKQNCWSWTPRTNVPLYTGKVLVEDEAARLAQLTVAETLTLIDKNKHQFAIRKTDEVMVASFTSHGIDFKWEFRSDLLPNADRRTLTFAAFAVQTPHQITHYRASSKEDKWELCN